MTVTEASPHVTRIEIAWSEATGGYVIHVHVTGVGPATAQPKSNDTVVTEARYLAEKLGLNPDAIERPAELAPTVADILDAAADRIARHGHAKTDFAVYANPGDLTKTACCMVGAIRISAGLTTKALVDQPHDDIPELARQAEEELAQLLIQFGAAECWTGDDFDPVETVAGWNDADNCDQDSAVEMLRDAAELAR